MPIDPLPTGWTVNCSIELRKVHLPECVRKQSIFIGFPFRSHAVNNIGKVILEERRRAGVRFF